MMENPPKNEGTPFFGTTPKLFNSKSDKKLRTRRGEAPKIKETPNFGKEDSPQKKVSVTPRNLPTQGQLSLDTLRMLRDEVAYCIKSVERQAA
jgi:hypothetical protein